MCKKNRDLADLRTKFDKSKFFVESKSPLLHTLLQYLRDVFGL